MNWTSSLGIGYWKFLPAGREIYLVIGAWNLVVIILITHKLLQHFNLFRYFFLNILPKCIIGCINIFFYI